MPIAEAVKKPLYVGLFLDAASRKMLLEIVPPKHMRIYADHLTLAFGEKMLAPSAYKIGEIVKITAWFAFEDKKGQAVFCSTGCDELLHPDQIPHITISCAEGWSPVYSNELIMDHPGDKMTDPYRFVTTLNPRLTMSGVLDVQYPRTIL